MSNLGYEKILTVAVQRTKHRIGFRVGMSAADLMELLSKLPPEAVVDYVCCEHEGEPDVTTIEFHEEAVIE